MTGATRRPLTALMAAAVLLAGFAGGAAVARDHDRPWGEGRHEGRGHDQGRPPPQAYGGQRGQWRGGPPPVYAPPPRYAPTAPRYAAPSPFGPPPGYAPSEAYTPRGYGVRRGGYLPPDLRGGMVQEYWRYRLRPPPRGYGWVSVGRSFALVDMQSGQIFDVVPY